MNEVMNEGRNDGGLGHVRAPSVRGITVLLAWMPQGRTVIMLKVQEWTFMVRPPVPPYPP